MSIKGIFTTALIVLDGCAQLFLAQMMESFQRQV
jgi:hypothetical protein